MPSFYVVHGQASHKIEVIELLLQYDPYGFHQFFTTISFIVVELYNFIF